MADADQLCETIVRELNDMVLCDGGDTEEELEEPSFLQDTVSDDIPPSLLSYFESSKSRAVRREKLILEELEDFSASRHLLVSPSETQAPCPHDLSVCPGSKDEAETGACIGPGARTITSPEKDEQTQRRTESREEHGETRRREEMRTEERRRQRHRDFQEELEKIIEAEKLHQRELELREKRAHEKLEEEFLLQQELISSLQKRVTEERKMREEEQKRIKEEAERRRREEEEERRRREEDRRKKEEEIIKREEKERKMMEEQMRRKIEEEEKRKIEEIKLKEELRRKREEEQRKMEEEEKRKIEEIKLKEELRRKSEEEQRKMEEEEKRRIEEIKLKEELRRKRDEEKMLLEEKEKRRIEEQEEMIAKTMEGDERRKNEEGMVQGESRKKQKQQDSKNRNEEHKKREEERRTKTEEMKKVEGRKIEEKGGNIEEEAMAQLMKERRDIKERQLKEDGEKREKDKEIKHNTEWTDMKKEEGKAPEEDERPERDVRKQREEEHSHTEEEMRLKKETQQNGDKTEERGVKGEEERFRGQDPERLQSQEKTENITPTSSLTVFSHNESTVCPSSSGHVQQLDPNKKILSKQHDSNTSPRTSSSSLPASLPEPTEQKRLTWMRDCLPWSKLSLQSRERVHGRSRRGRSRTSEACPLPPLCPQTLLQSTGCRSLLEVTTVTLEDLPGCSFASLAQCPHLQSLTLRRCGLQSLEGFNQLPRLCCVDMQENSISFVDCENMVALQVLRLGHNRLTSIHGLSGADNLRVLDLSHNSITRIAGLDSVRRLQSLSLDHNQLISTKGLRDACTLLHLDCSHNHLACVEGLESCVLLQTLDLRSNSLTEPPAVNDHVLLRELRLDDNSISSLQGLVVCWLPLMHQLSAAENRMTLLPSMSDFVSLTNLDLRFNCMSELQNVCEAVKGCLFLEEVHLSGNPLQQETGWRGAVQRAAPGLRAIDGEETDPFLSAPAVGRLSSAPGSFLTFCQAQLKQMRDLQRRHSRELSNAPTPLDAVRSSCRHVTEALELAVDQRFAHEYGNTTVCAGQTLDMDSAGPKTHAELPEIGSREKSPPVLNSTNIKRTLDLPSLATMETDSSRLKTASASKHRDPDPKNTAAVVIQQRWRKYRQKRGNISSPPTAEKGGERGGDGGTPESGSSHVDRSAVGQDHAATIIQAFWRGSALRRRLATALAAVTGLDSREDEAFEELDVDGFAFDEAALEKRWTLSEHHCGSVKPLSLKLPGLCPQVLQHTLPPSPSWRPKQAWVTGEQLDSSGMKVSPESSIRSKSPASTRALSRLSARSEKILQEWGFQNNNTAVLMLKRAQKMRSKKQKQKHKAPSVCLALFGNCKYQQAPVEARNRPAPRNRHHMKVCRAELDLRQAEQTEQVRQERAQQWLQNQSDTDSESEHFLPEISSVVLNGGRVQLVADPAEAERLRHASGLWASSSLDAQPCKERNYPCNNSLGHARKEAPSLHRVESAPSKKERISFRDIPVQLSSGWGGGKKRGKVYK